MSVAIAPIRPSVAAIPIGPVSPPVSSQGTFRSVLKDAVSRVEQLNQSSNNAIGKFLSGEDEEVHKVALASQQAGIAFDLFLQIRNKVISAYQEVMRMQM
jgi:flagellar hook-basal body complex protein FliE